MNNLYNQYQTDVTGAANNMMTQLICAEKGIDYNQLMYAAQQSHLNGIMQAEQQRQMQNLVKRHYQGNSGSIMSKIKDVFAPDTPNMMMPMMPMPGMQPMVQNPMLPQAGLTPQQVSSYMVTQPQPATEIPFEDNRVEVLEKEMASIKEMLTTLTNTLQK
jgi:hypothetical protein